MGRIYCPTNSAEDWKRFLADPDLHWKPRYSAFTLASCWEAANGLPTEVAALFGDEGSELLIALPEHKVRLPGSSRGESQNDLFVLCRAGERTFAITIEGKVDEPFDRPVGEWLENASPGKRERLSYLQCELGLAGEVPADVYYQLLHRTASAVIEAKRFKTDAAAMVVHSFSRERKWFDAFARFVGLFGREASAGKLIELRSGPPALYAAWVCGDPKFLEVT